jgi:hypothetical protein
MFSTKGMGGETTVLFFPSRGEVAVKDVKDPRLEHDSVTRSTP